MTSTTRNRYGDFSTNPAISKSDQSRAFQGGSLGQNFAASNNWDGGIWGNAAIGSVLRSGTNDNGRSQLLVDTNSSDTTETFTGSGSLLPSSESDTWARPKTTQWPSANTISPGLSNVRTSQPSTSPVRHRGNQQGRSGSPYFSIPQPSTVGHGMSNKSVGQNHLDPTSGSFKVPSAFEPQYQGISSRQNSDEAIRRPSNTIIFGSSDSGYPSQTTRSNSNTNVGYSGYSSSVASRSGSIPPSRNSIDNQSQLGTEYSLQFGSSEPFVHRSMHSSRASNYSANRNHRFQNPGSSLQFGDLTTSLGKLEIGREIQEPSYPSYLEHAQQAGAGHINTISAMNNNAYRGNHSSLEPDTRQGASYGQHRIQFGDRSTHSPSSSEFRRSHESPLYSTTATPPLNDHQRAPSTTSLRSNTSHKQAALLEQKLRGLHQEQQNYIAPQLNVQFRNPYTPTYDYSSQALLRMNPLAQFYPVQHLGTYATSQVVPRSSVVDTAAGESLRSSLLEEFRSNNKGNKRYELKDIYDHVVEFSGDQHGSRFIQQKLETANSDEKDQIFREILPNSLQLMTDVFGNYVIQKFFEHGNQSQKKILANQMKGHILDLSLQMYGCRVVQKAFEHILTDQQASLVKELEYQVLKCVKDQNGNHVVQKAIERIPAEHIQFIINAFTGQVHGLATHSYGCRVIQRMLEHCQEPARGLLLEELHCCASSLIVDQYGNYVTQHVIEHGRPEDRAKIISLITAQLIHFSKHKFASNVVEKSIQFGTDEQRQTIVRLLTAVDEKGESPLQQLMRDQYGNYVIQKLLAQLKGSEYDVFVDQIKTQLQQAKRFSYGKQVGAIEKLVNSSPTTFPHIHPNTSPPARLDTSAVPTPPLLTEDTQSPQTSSLPSTNTSTVDGPIGDRKPTAGISVEVMATSSV